MFFLFSINYCRSNLNWPSVRVIYIGLGCEHHALQENTPLLTPSGTEFVCVPSVCRDSYSFRNPRCQANKYSYAYIRQCGENQTGSQRTLLRHRTPYKIPDVHMTNLDTLCHKIFFYQFGGLCGGCPPLVPI